VPSDLPNPESFIESYGLEAKVKIGADSREMTLGQALAFEQMFCPAETTKREDPTKRLGYLAHMLAAAGSLRPEDQYLIEARE
jgi:hypothetical protein